MSDPLLPASDGRTPGGQFKTGNSFGRGNPQLVRMHALRRRLLDAVDEGAMGRVAAKLVALAEGGDLDAIKLLLAYAIGKPATTISLTGPEGQGLGDDVAKLGAALLDAVKPFGAAAELRVVMALQSLAGGDDARPGD